MLGHHYRNIIQSCRTFCEPSVCIVERELRFSPAARPLWRDEIPELIQIPERVPEGIAAEHHVVGRVIHAMLFAIGGNPLAVAVAPYIAAAECAIHIVVEFSFFYTVVGLYLYTAEEVVPCVDLILPYCIEVPAEGSGKLSMKVFGGIGDAYGRYGCADVHYWIFGSGECGENSGIPTPARFEFVGVGLYFIVAPAAH